MKKLFLIFSVFFFSLTCYAQTADQIISKHLEATGGIINWKSFNSVILKGEMVLGINETYPVEVYQQRPDVNKTVMIVQDKRIIINGYNGKKAVQYNFNKNKLETVTDYTPETFDSDLLDHASKGFQAVLEGIEKTDKSEHYKIKLIKNTNTITYYFDTKTYQLKKEVNAEETKTYSDFKKVSNLTFPYRIEVKSNDGQTDFVLSLHTIEVNKNISSKEFNF